MAKQIADRSVTMAMAAAASGISSPMLVMTATHHLHTTPNGACYISTNGHGTGRLHGSCDQQYVNHTQIDQRHCASNLIKLLMF
jgi:hypothetical protein